MFTADYPSSSASTPNDPPRRRNLFANQTPSLASTTPLVPPPSHPFGSSQFGSGVSKLQFGRTSTNPPTSEPRGRIDRRLDSNSKNHPARLSQFSTNTQDTYEDEADDYTQDMEEEAWEDDDQSQELPSQRIPFLRPSDGRKGETQGRNFMELSTAATSQPPMKSSLRWSKAASHYSELPRKGQEDFILGLARDYGRQTRIAGIVNDSDDIVVGTEQILRQLEEEGQNTKDDHILDVLLSECAEALRNTWEGPARSRKRKLDGNISIGPGQNASPFENARFIASLLLELHNPRTEADGTKPSVSERLLCWLNDYHATHSITFTQVVRTSPNPTASEFFWDVVESLTARGLFEDVAGLLAEADFSYARFDNGQRIEDANYTGREQQVIQDAVLRARQVLNICPAFESQNWDLDTQDWDVYRKELEAALEHLTELAGGDGRDNSAHNNQMMNTFGTSERTGQKLPFEVYDRLRTVYHILLGSSSELIAISNDWLEASILLTAWWNGAPAQKVAQWSFDVSQATAPQHLVNSRQEAYMGRLKEAFLSVTDPTSQESFQLNTLSPLELSLGAVLQGDTSCALGVLQTLSQCVTTSLAEIGTWSDWFVTSAPPNGFNQEDLMVLTNGASGTGLRRDGLLEHYARTLFDKPQFRTTSGLVVEGWELAFSVASRIEDQNLVKTTIDLFIDELEVTDKERAERIVSLCDELGLVEESRKVSEAFGDHLVNNTTNYGLALLCYARSHSETKVRKLIDLLNSYCLVQSKAYPTESELDPALAHLVGNPKSALSSMAEVDPQAVETLQFYLVGYACLRRFYNVRDDVVSSSSKDGQQQLSPLRRKKAAAKALIAAINSAADSIYGGLYDAERQSAIQVDGLLTLLGEATALLAENQDNSILNANQMYAILAATEDLQTVSDRVYTATEECLEASLRNYHGSLPPSPHAMLKKSMSSGTNSNFSFSMMGSEMLSRSEESIGAKSLGSAVLVGSTGKDSELIKRGWDWRSRFKDRGITGAEVLRFLRKGIARELSIADLKESMPS